MGNAKTALIIALAKKRATGKRGPKDDDEETCAKELLDAFKAGDAKELARALRAFNDVTGGS